MSGSASLKQLPLPLATPIEPPRPSRPPAVERALALLRRAVADCGYTPNALESSMGRHRTHIHAVLHGRRRMSLRFFVALPEEVEARFEALRSELFGLQQAKPANGRTPPDLVSGLRLRLVHSEEGRVPLRRYLATWTDGVTRVIHARRLVLARQLAADLEVPDGVFVRSVKPLR
jgi:hypothetical protein